MPPLPDLVLYARPGCHLCTETRAALELLLERRRAAGLAVPRLVEVDIDADPGLQRACFDVVPVVELGGSRIELATSVAALRKLLTDVLDSAPAPVPAVG